MGWQGPRVHGLVGGQPRRSGPGDLRRDCPSAADDAWTLHDRERASRL